MRTPNQTLWLAAIASAVAPTTLLAAKKSTEQKPLNILYIMSDDHTSNAIGAYGSRLASLDPTPNIDELASEGVVFDNCFCSNSISTPSRASIITGQYSHHNGVTTLGGAVQGENQSLPLLMKSLGYQTAMVGKWHLKEEPTGFDFYSVFPSFQSQGTYFDPIFANSEVEGTYPDNILKTKGFSSDIITDQTLDWFENKREKDKPFFVMHHFKAPHGKWENAPRYDSYLEDVDIPMPETMLNREGFGSVATRGENNSLDGYLGSSVSSRHLLRNQNEFCKVDHGNFEQNAIESYNNYLKAYLRCVKGVDDNVERLFDYLKENDLWDSTIIIYTGDQGQFLGEHDFFDKRWMYEECMRMPFIMRVPGSKLNGKHSDLMIGNIDFAPTLLSLAGLEATPEEMDGSDFSSIFFSKKDPEGWRTASYYRYWMHLASHYNPSHFGIRTKDYKLMFFYGIPASLKPKKPANYVTIEEVIERSKGQKTKGLAAEIQRSKTPAGFELYDLKKDPKETTNVANDPAYAEVLASLKVELLELKAAVGDTDETNPDVLEIIKANF